MWKQTPIPKFDKEYLCHPWYWELSYAFKYLKERGWEKSDRLIRNWCQKGTIKAVKIEELGTRDIWMVYRQTIINIAHDVQNKQSNEMESKCQDIKID